MLAPTAVVDAGDDEAKEYIFEAEGNAGWSDASPLLFHDGRVIGAARFNSRRHKRTEDQPFGEHQIRWFEHSDGEGQGRPVTIAVKPEELRMNKMQMGISYPLVAYSGITPDNREIILANFADREYPQQIIHLPGQLICFMGASTYYCEINMLLQEGDDMAVYTLEKRRPFKK